MRGRVRPRQKPGDASSRSLAFETHVIEKHLLADGARRHATRYALLFSYHDSGPMGSFLYEEVGLDSTVEIPGPAAFHGAFSYASQSETHSGRNMNDT